MVEQQSKQSVDHVNIRAAIGHSGLSGVSNGSNLNVHNCVVIELTTNKSFCMNKAIKRDIRERGKNKKIAESDFLNSWNFYHLNKNINSKNNFIKINLSKENDLEQFLNKIIK